LAGTSDVGADDFLLVFFKNQHSNPISNIQGMAAALSGGGWEIFFECKSERVRLDCIIGNEERAMKAIHFLMGLVLYLALAAAGMLLMASVVMVEPSCLHKALAWGRLAPAWGRVLIGLGILVYMFVYLLSGISWRKKRELVTFENEDGAVHVSTEAVQDYLNGLKDEFAAVAWLKTRLRAQRGALAVAMYLGVKEHTQIPELCKLIQARVREILQEHLGTCDLLGISVEVTEIQTRKKSERDDRA
jgi:hypothetical protein